nr:LLM class flavin-dependent oxidoreductase [Kibdelosporangium sp. MJ126-NF4]CEL13359.1 Alkanal monooxygenase alpha chain [Kibdelosporangium sp. MJ126-NF4]CTQ99049.1 Alkanal monooxygenase alpha chain (EC 1.14.14.3) [Kibdelosporangium sp. MJ126-NF4]
MRFSLYLNAQSPGPGHDLDVIEAITAQALLADRNGFTGICLTEHHFTGYNTYGNPFTFGAYLAPQLENAHIVLSVAVPALWHPMNFAESCNTLDLLTRGRCVIGFGTGGSPQEYKGLGRDPQQRGPMMEEVIQVALRAMDKTLDDPDMEYATTHSSGVLTRRIMPTSFTKPRPRFGRATLSDEGIVYAAQKGWALMTARADVAETGRRLALYHQTLDEAGHDEETVAFARHWSMVQKMVYVGESDESALVDVSAPLDYLAEQSRRTFGGTAREAGFKNSVVGVAATDRDAFLAKAMIVGGPDTVVREIEAYRAAGVAHLSLVFIYGQLDADLAHHSLRRFIDEVMPRVTDPVSTAERHAVSATAQA